MKKISLFLILSIQLLSIKIFSQDWVLLNTPGMQGATTMEFVNQNTGFVTAGNQIFRTNDAGITWGLTANTTYQSFYTQFLNQNTGFTYGIYKIQSTTNCGNSWDVVTLDSALRAIYFADEYTWYTSTVNNAIRKTTDKGQTWQYLHALLPTAYAYRTIHFMNTTTGFIAGDNGGGVSALGLIRKTTNGGVNWITRTTLTGVEPRSFTFVNATTGYLSANYKIYKTTDAGDSWQEYVTPNNRDVYYSINFPNSSTGFAAGNNNFTGNTTVIKTTNGGETWFEIINNNGMFFSDIFFTDVNVGYICGSIGVSSGCILKTTTGGLTYITQTSSNVPKLFSLSQNYPNPFNPSTVVSYQLPVAGFVQLKVYDVLGNEIETLVNEKQNAGSYSVDFNAASLPSGIYFYKLVTDRFSETKKMILMK